MNHSRFAGLLLASTFFGNGVAAAATLQVMDGCAPLPVAGTGNVFYIDPVNGTATGDGSKLHPWNSLAAINGSVVYSNPAWQLPGCNNNSSCTSGPLLSTQSYSHVDPVSKNTVTSVNPNAPIKAGDTILLMNGNYGNVSINGVANPSYITIAAAPGATPVFSSLQLVGSAQWLVQGVKFRALADDYTPFVTITGNAFYGPGHDIILDSDDFASQDDVSGWSQADWVAKARWIAVNVDGGDANSSRMKCVSVTNNAFKNLRLGIVAEADNMLVQQNTLDNMGDDYIDFAANNLIIAKNTLTNALDIGDGNHADAIQGATGNGIGGSTVFNNILIDGNVIIAKNKPSLTFGGEFQGITAFDMDWSNVTVINNVVVTNTYHGLSFYSLHGGLIANNTVLGTSAMNTWIGVFDTSHQGYSSNNVIVRNNIASTLDIDAPAPTITTDHNLVGTEIVWQVNGGTQWLTAPATYGTQNVIDPKGLTTVFQAFNVATSTYDVHLLAGSLAVGTGNATAPLDMNGYARPTPVDLGAYELVPPTIVASAATTPTTTTTPPPTTTTSTGTTSTTTTPPPTTTTTSTGTTTTTTPPPTTTTKPAPKPKPRRTAWR